MRKLKAEKIFPAILSVLLVTILFAAIPFFSAPSIASSASYNSSTTLDILSTSDIHCRYLPYDYTKDQEDTAGSMARLSSIVKSIRGKADYSILIDVGDSIQGSLSQAYINSETHPFANASNFMNYDIWVLGNHEFNFGIAPLRSVMSQMNAKVLCGNVYNPDGTPFAPSYAIINKGGIRIGVIGMVTPSVTVFASDHLAGYKVTNPLEETKKIVKKIRKECDVLIAAEHIGLDEEYHVYGSGAQDLAEACPEIDVILAAHAHKKVPEKFINGVLITENQKQGKTLSDIRIRLAKNADGSYRIIKKNAVCIEAKEYDPDPSFINALHETQELSDKENSRVIGTLTGSDLTCVPAFPPASVQITEKSRPANPRPRAAATNAFYRTGKEVNSARTVGQLHCHLRQQTDLRGELTFLTLFLSPPEDRPRL